MDAGVAGAGKPPGAGGAVVRVGVAVVAVP